MRTRKSRGVGGSPKAIEEVTHRGSTIRRPKREATNLKPSKIHRTQTPPLACPRIERLLLGTGLSRGHFRIFLLAPPDQIRAGIPTHPPPILDPGTTLERAVHPSLESGVGIPTLNPPTSPGSRFARMPLTGSWLVSSCCSQDASTSLCPPSSGPCRKRHPHPLQAPSSSPPEVQNRHAPQRLMG